MNSSFAYLNIVFFIFPSLVFSANSPNPNQSFKPQNDKPQVKAPSSGRLKSSAKKKSSTPAKLFPLLQELETKYKANPGFTAEFTQKVKTPTSKREKISKGVLQILNPGKIRWEIQSPDHQLMVSDGKTFWHYTPPFEATDRGQVIMKKASQVKTPVLDALLAGRFSNSSGLTIQSKGQRTFILLPKKGGALSIKKITVDLHQTELQLQKLLLEYKDGNQTEISLENVQFTKTLPLEPFEFKIPDRTDVINE